MADDSCASCQRPFGRRKVQAPGGYYHPECICSGCLKIFTDKYVTTGRQKNWHPECVCPGCSLALQGDCTPGFGGREWHAQCWKCDRCGLNLMRNYRQAVNLGDAPHCEECVNNNADLYQAFKNNKKMKKKGPKIKNIHTHPIEPEIDPRYVSSGAPKTVVKKTKKKRKDTASAQAAREQWAQDNMDTGVPKGSQKAGKQSQQQQQQTDDGDHITETKVILCCTVM